MLPGIGSLFGPLLAGVASSVVPSGLPILLVIIAALFLVSTMDRFNPQSDNG
ncbi:hypothetical protein [Photorhabdus heterorhabditis]|uniref:hypothetical protein n=1 Tax=Photorhabdus heterorhabditis TaxID=880156 RepID=UPI000AF0078E|nr:hypothetical protein [Photorhabdus heterorhabditis]